MALLAGPGCGSGTEETNAGKANVIVVILDSLRRDHVGAYGNDLVRTPTLAALAGEGLRFSRALPEAPTVGSRSQKSSPPWPRY